MARRARDHRKDIPGYDGGRPGRDDRKRQHRQVRHAANQILATVDDPEDLTLPDVRGNGAAPSPESADRVPSRRFRVWKTKFWKRRHRYQAMRSRLDADWPVVTEHQLGERMGG